MLPASPKFPVIVGPTAGGKSALAVECALQLGSRGFAAEIVTADSMQIYRGMDIGTAKPTLIEQAGIPHHLINIVDPGHSFSVSDWLALAEVTIAQIQSRGAVPIVVGGTHLYIKSFMEGMFDGPGNDPKLRAELSSLAPHDLRMRLEAVDPPTAAKLHPNDIRRTVRALEVFELTGIPISQHQSQWDKSGGVRTDCVLIGLDWPSHLLNPRINGRVRSMMEAGLLEETRALFQAGAFARPVPPEINQAREALGYKQILEHLEGSVSLEEAVEQIKIDTRRFGKAQRTWIRRLRLIPGSRWIDPSSVPQEKWSQAVFAAMADSNTSPS